MAEGKIGSFHVLVQGHSTLWFLWGQVLPQCWHARRGAFILTAVMVSTLPAASRTRTQASNAVGSCPTLLTQTIPWVSCALETMNECLLRLGHLTWNMTGCPYKAGGGFPGGTVVTNTPANAGDKRDTGLIPGSGRSPGGGQPPPVSLPGKCYGRRSLTV